MKIAFLSIVSFESVVFRYPFCVCVWMCVCFYLFVCFLGRTTLENAIRTEYVEYLFSHYIYYDPSKC